jgi:hypothetical protein
MCIRSIGDQLTEHSFHWATNAERARHKDRPGCIETGCQDCDCKEVSKTSAEYSRGSTLGIHTHPVATLRACVQDSGHCHLPEELYWVKLQLDGSGMGSTPAAIHGQVLLSMKVLAVESWCC